jgi:Polyketide cyclase / dehydrase and lipid transport
MTNGSKAPMQVAEPTRTALGLRKRAVAGRYRLLSSVLAHRAVSEVIVTRVHIRASAHTVWDHLVLYEQVPGRAPFLLRTLLPQPLGTDGDKTQVGATVRCVYQGSDLVKRITAVEPHRLLQFEVVEQRLGIEDCVLTRSGSYEIHACGEAADVVLTTNYEAYLRPRYLWRRVEALLVSQLHRHILFGVNAALLARHTARGSALARPFSAECALTGDLTCTTFQSVSRR